MTFAINWDVSNDAAWDAMSPTALREAGFQGVRLKASQAAVPSARTQHVLSAGLDVCAVLEWESENWIPPGARWAQVLNEMTTGADPMSAAAYARAWKAARAANPDYTGGWMTGGLALGRYYDLPWLGRFLRAIPRRLYPDAIALHVYTLSPEDVQSYCDAVYTSYGIPVAVTEWWRSAEEGHHPMQCVLGGNGLDGQGPRAPSWNSFFCLSSHMTWYTEGRMMGLLNLMDDPTDEWYSLLSAPEDCRR